MTKDLRVSESDPRPAEVGGRSKLRRSVAGSVGFLVQTQHLQEFTGKFSRKHADLVVW